MNLIDTLSPLARAAILDAAAVLNISPERLHLEPRVIGREVSLISGSRASMNIDPDKDFLLFRCMFGTNLADPADTEGKVALRFTVGADYLIGANAYGVRLSLLSGLQDGLPLPLPRLITRSSSHALSWESDTLTGTGKALAAFVGFFVTAR